MHSGDYTKAKEYEGKKVVVVGACTSGMLSHHQSALDTLSFLSANDRPRHSKGPSRPWSRYVPGFAFVWPWKPKRSSDVTMFQRSSTYIMSVKHGVTRVFGSSFISPHEKFGTEDLL